MTDSKQADLFGKAKPIAHKLGVEPSWFHKKQEPTFTADWGKEGHEPMLLLHGLFGAMSNWDDVFPLFEQYTRPIALQLPILSGHRTEVKVKALALYAWYFLMKEQFEPLVVCGNSLGGHVALRLCLAAPERVKCLILTGTSGLYEHAVDTLPIRPQHDFIKDQMERVFVNPKFINEQAIEEMCDIVRDRNNVLNIIHAARSAKRDNLYDLLPEIKVPTLLLWGEDDQVTPMDVAETFNQRMPNSKLVTIKQCGHAPMIEHPQWFAKEVKTFLEETKE